LLKPSLWPENVRASLLLITGISVLGLSDNLVKFVSHDIGLGQYHFIRSVFSVLVFLLICIFHRLPLRPVRWGPVLLRTFFISVSMTLFFAVLSFLPVAIAGAGLFSSPIFVLLFSVFWFGLRPGWRRLLAVCMGTAGMWFILRPDTQSFETILLFPVLAGAFYALASITTRRYCASESPYALTFAYFFMVGLIGCVWALFVDIFSLTSLNAQTDFILRGFSWPSAISLGWMAVMSGISVLAIWMLTRAYQIAETSYVVVFEYCYLISAGFFGWLIWDHHLSAEAFLGIILIIIAGVIVGFAAARDTDQKIESQKGSDA